MDMQLKVDIRPDSSIFASYTCPCGCNPGVALAEGTEVATEGCCCGNEFAVGRDAGHSLEARGFSARPGYHLQVVPIQAPWGRPIEAAWAIGQSEHPATEIDHGRDGDVLPAGKALDPVCGMTVDIAAATGKGLLFTHEGRDYYFCGKGCRLDFEEEPQRILDPNYIPSM